MTDEKAPTDPVPGFEPPGTPPDAETAGGTPAPEAPAETPQEATPSEAAPAETSAAAPPPPAFQPPPPPASSPPAAPPIAPAPVAAPIVTAGAQPAAGASPGGPTEFTAAYPEESSRLWALLFLLFGIKTFVMILHVLVLGVLGIGALVVFVVAQAMVLFTGRMPEGMHRFQVSVLAQSNKVNGWIYGLTDVLPPFAPSDDPYPVETSVGHPAQSSRLWALLNIVFLKPVALLPHVIVLYVLAFAMAVVVFIAQIMILVTGRFPRGMFDFVVGVLRWQTRVYAFLYGLRDEYPPFSLQ